MDPVTIVAGISALAQLSTLIAKTIEDRRRTGELTTEEAKAWEDYTSGRMSQPHWNPSSSAPKPLSSDIVSRYAAKLRSAGGSEIQNDTSTSAS